VSNEANDRTIEELTAGDIETIELLRSDATFKTTGSVHRAIEGIGDSSINETVENVRIVFIAAIEAHAAKVSPKLSRPSR